MIETGLVLGMTATHLGVPLADLVAWALVLALLAAPIQLDDARRQMAARKQKSDASATRSLPLAGRPAVASAVASRVGVVVPAAKRLSPADQWQAVSRLVTSGAERAMTVARDQQAIRRELDSLDFSLENMRRELAAVMTLPAMPRAAELLPVRVAHRSHALAA